LYSHQILFGGSKQKKIICAEHVAYTRERRGRFRVICGENLRKRDHLKDKGVGGRIILQWIFRKWDREYGLD
jgi:hypothetical protein